MLILNFHGQCIGNALNINNRIRKKLGTCVGPVPRGPTAESVLVPSPWAPPQHLLSLLQFQFLSSKHQHSCELTPVPGRICRENQTPPTASLTYRSQRTLEFSPRDTYGPKVSQGQGVVEEDNPTSPAHGALIYITWRVLMVHLAKHQLPTAASLHLSRDLYLRKNSQNLLNGQPGKLNWNNTQVYKFTIFNQNSKYIIEIKG